ncbi:hypothetical protein JCM21900_002101 [Sporobolomyces salmonicolor]
MAEGQHHLPPPFPSPSSLGHKRPSDALDEGSNEGEGTSIKDEDSSGGGAGGPPRKNRNAAPPLKRGSACMLCRKRKLRCDGIRPKCGTCLRLNHDCVYGDPAHEKMAERQRELEDRVRTLESELEHYRRGGTPAPGMMNGHPYSSFPPPSSTGRPAISRPGSFPALNMPSGEASSPYPAPLQPMPPPPPHYPAYGHPYPPSQPHLPLDSPYLFQHQPQGDPSAAGRPHIPLAQPNQHGYPPHLQHPRADSEAFPSRLQPPRADSEAFPLPPPLQHGGPSGAAFLSRFPIPGSANAPGGNSAISPTGASPSSAHPSHQQAHLQSFPFPMNPTPQLADLINPSTYSPVSAGATVPYHPDGSPMTDSPTTPAPAQHAPPVSNGYPQQQQHQNQGYTGLSLHPHLAGGPQRQQPPFDQQSSLSSPERHELNTLGVEATVGGDRAAETQEGQGELAQAWAADLPEVDLMLDLADIYFATIHRHLPFLHRPRFLFTLRHPASLSSPPSLSLIFAVLAVAAGYHDSPHVRAQQTTWSHFARAKVELAIQAGVRPTGTRVASLTVEVVQALCLLTLLEMGQSDHQRAFLSIGQAMRIAAMLGLHRMDEDRLSERDGRGEDKRLRPPALHELPMDGVLLEECRRTMCAVFVLDRFEAGCVGWPAAVSEADCRLLLPCADELYEAGTCTSADNPLWWPEGGIENEDDERNGDGRRNPKVGTFAWLCRVCWCGGRIQHETYRPSGPPAGGPWNKNIAMDPLSSSTDILEMDKLLDFIRAKLGSLAAVRATTQKGVDGPLIMILIVLNCLFVNLHHLRAATGLVRLPFDPSTPIFIGSAEYSMQRCWEAIHSLYEIVSQLAGYENSRTALHRSKLTTFTGFVPYVLYCIAFPAKFAIGDWSVLVNSRDRTENVPAHLGRANLPRGDDVFPPQYFEQRLKMVDALCNAMERAGAVWPIGNRFASMVSGDRVRLATRTHERDQHAPQSSTPAQPPSHLHPQQQQQQRQQQRHQQRQQQQSYPTSPSIPSDNGY